jgi:hypothetical protein
MEGILNNMLHDMNLQAVVVNLRDVTVIELRQIRL